MFYSPSDKSPLVFSALHGWISTVTKMDELPNFETLKKLSHDDINTIMEPLSMTIDDDPLPEPEPSSQN